MTKLHLRDDDFEDLWDRFDKTRSTSATVVVPRSALFNLLRDHSTMYGELTDGAVQSKRPIT